MSAVPRIGLIIPSSNRLSEPQFHAYAPPGVGVHVTRLRMTGKWRKPWQTLKPALEEAAATLSDAKPGVIVFHCTANSMENGLSGEAALVKTVETASGCPALATGQAIIAALKSCAVERLVLITPYVKETNRQEIRYLEEAGFSVSGDIALGLQSDGYIAVTPEQWVGIVRENARPDVDGYLLSCTNTRTIEVIADLEKELAKPVITSNQATLWACIGKLGLTYRDPRLGRLLGAA